jgi:hypothetical protein
LPAQQNGATAVIIATKIALAAALILGLSSAAIGQTVKSNPAAGSQMSRLAISDISAQRAPVRQTRNVALSNYDGQGVPVTRAAVGPDNYQNWRQACCL